MIQRTARREGVFRARSFDLHGLQGISDRTLDMHLGLYAGYVEEANRLSEILAGIIEDGEVDQEEMPAYSEIKRRLAFEYNGMVFHELYFENLTPSGQGDPRSGSSFVKAAERSFGGYSTWKADFLGVGKMRGVGWAICYEEPASGRLSNHWVTLHEMDILAASRITG